MTPTLVAKTEIVYVWDCGIDSHRHHTETAAINCVNKSPGAIANRNNQMYELSKKQSMADIAKEFGLSYSRVRQIVNKMRLAHD